jgi:hypothetical protein
MLSALYDADEDAAERIEPAQRRDARSQDGRVERHGTVTIVWRYGHEGRFAERARGCIL